MSTVYLRQFPGKRRFERVSKDDWEARLPLKDIAGWGHVGRLELDVQVYRPDGELVIARKMPSRSYIRNFARILRNTFGENVQLVDRTGTARTVPLNNNPSSGGLGLIPQIFQETTFVGTSANPELSGAGFAIGDGVPAEVHTRNDLVSRVSPVISARNDLRTSVLNTSTTTLELTCGITNSTAASVNVTEIGMFLFAVVTAVATGSIPFSTLLAYDGITSTPVAAGGVIAPRYTMDFPM